ncbi:MAG: 50S ribosomal protein L9 [Thermoleophilia bacterium]|jgi:large subunit ribosomal protein L9|nr:50S ribosomal protein L9 [Thermoleophilia bacterium]
MQAILLQEVDGLGAPGTVVNVARGYMRNYLLPRGLAEEATPARIAEVRRREEQRVAAEVRASEQARELASLLGRTILTLKAKAGHDGRLFGSITAADVSNAIFEARGVRVDRREISVDPPIRNVGTYTVPVNLGPGGVTEVKTIVSPLLDD